MTIYDTLGVKTIINAKGPATRLSGGPMAADVAEAMAAAARACIDMNALHARASAVIAEHTGAEAGLVTSGASAGLLLATAACVARLDIAAMARLPDVAGLKDQVVMVRSQRNFYDHAARAVGVTIVEVGLPDRYAGAGVRDAEPWEVADAITERTAAVYYVADPAAKPALAEVVAVAHAADVPVIVDAAAQLPPAANLRRFIDVGADLVAFSGGKAIGGPQGAGILAGRRDLIMSAALQCLDMDIVWDQWSPPEPFIDKTLLNGVPQHGIGRSCKVGKETIVGLVTALDLYATGDPAARHAVWLTRLRAVEQGLSDLNSVTATMINAADTELLPLLELAVGPEAQDLITRLQNDAPSVNLDPAGVDRGAAIVNPMCLEDDQIPVLIQQLRKHLSA